MNTKIGHIRHIGLIVVAITASVSAQTGITFVNPGSSPDATDGDTIRNAFIKCNNDFTYIGGQLSALNNSLAGLGTTYDLNGMALLMGLNATNYVRYAVGTNTVGFLCCLNLESNVFQSDITALTNNVNSLWTTMGGASLLHSGGQMMFDQDPNWPHEMQILSDGSGDLTVYGSIHAGTFSDSYNNSGGVFPGMVATSQGNDGTWQWQALPLPAGFTESGSGSSLSAVFGGAFQATYLVDSYNSSPVAGMVATSVGTDGTWQWQTPPTLPATLNFDGGSITSDGSGDATFVSIYAQQLKDSGSWTGSAGYYAQANGSGGWAWTEWPYTLSYDGGAVYSDGSGNLYATALKAELWDSGYSFGGSGQIPTANGDGTWTWQTPATGMDSGGGGGGTMNFDGGNITSDGGGDVTIGGTASFMSGQAAIQYGGNGVQLKINGGSGYQSGGAQIDVAGVICMTAAGEVDIGNNGRFTDPSPGAGYDVKCGGAAGGITSIGQINANGGFLFGNSPFLDSDGNCWAQTFNPISDRARKERILPLAPTNALAMALALGDYTWRFKAHTNTSGHVQPASGTEFGPMAQDWHAVTGLGGGTNISMTSMSGLLLGAIQGLAQTQGIFTNAAGARFALVVNAQTNGFIFVPE